MGRGGFRRPGSGGREFAGWFWAEHNRPAGKRWQKEGRCDNEDGSHGKINYSRLAASIGRTEVSHSAFF